MRMKTISISKAEHLTSIVLIRRPGGTRKWGLQKSQVFPPDFVSTLSIRITIHCHYVEVSYARSLT